MSRKHLIQLVGIAIIIGCPVSASACNICAMAYFDYFLPPFTLWILFPVIWFVTACDAANKHIPHTWGLPIRYRAILIGFSVIIIGLVIYIPFLSLFLLIPPILLAINTANKNVRNKWDKKQRIKYITVSITGGIALASLLCFSLWTNHNRTRAEFIINWSEYGPGRSLVQQIKSNPTDLAELRQIVSQASIYTAVQLTEILAKNGAPKIDFPILLEVLIKNNESIYRHDIEQALKILTGIELPEDSSIEDWQKAFDQQYNSANNIIE